MAHHGLSCFSQTFPISNVCRSNEAIHCVDTEFSATGSCFFKHVGSSAADEYAGTGGGECYCYCAAVASTCTGNPERPVGKSLPAFGR